MTRRCYQMACANSSRTYTSILTTRLCSLWHGSSRLKCKANSRGKNSTMQWTNSGKFSPQHNVKSFTRSYSLMSMSRCDSIDKLRNKLLQIEADLTTDHIKFKDLYQFTFNFAKSPNQKSLDLEDAIAYWKMILTDRFKNLDTWIVFLQVLRSHFKLDCPQNYLYGKISFKGTS